jgi:DNA-binding NarL/FixJ family response regulator
MHQSEPEDQDMAAITIIDTMKLRRAAVSSFVRDWATSNSMSVMPVEADAMVSDENSASYKMAILNIGSSAISSPGTKQVINQIRTSAPNVPLVILSDSDDPEQVILAFKAGARGFIPIGMDPSLALKALSFILSGGSLFPPSALTWLLGASSDGVEPLQQPKMSLQLNPCLPSTALTPRQQQVMHLLRMGKSNKLIAQELGMQEATVKVHVRQILRKFQASNRTQAAIQATRMPASEPSRLVDGEMSIRIPEAS